MLSCKCTTWNNTDRLFPERGVAVEPIIKIKGLRKVYRLGGEKVVALGRINLDIQPETICCILGTSGSGKSTLLNQLAGLEKPTGGDVFVLGKNISKMDEKQLAVFRQKHLGFVFQSYNLLQGMSAEDNVALPLTFRGVPKTMRRKMARKMLEQVGLKERAKHRPNQMSGGQQQRVGIARAFVCKPKVVFADEPTGNLDSKTTIEVMELMVEMARKNHQTIVLVTHDTELAAYADRIITLVDGNIVDDRPNTPCYVPEFVCEKTDGQAEAPPVDEVIDDPEQTIPGESAAEEGATI
ncbi:MAG: ABC transporter ATP-binding protein [Oscillospiraceae bacterium]|nr:ABC transporter ATP-binding protein [Oscillospiraceae bacterium]